jgi:hypothetical protein
VERPAGSAPEQRAHGSSSSSRRSMPSASRAWQSRECRPGLRPQLSVGQRAGQQGQFPVGIAQGPLDLGQVELPIDGAPCSSARPSFRYLLLQRWMHRLRAKKTRIASKAPNNRVCIFIRGDIPRRLSRIRKIFTCAHLSATAGFGGSSVWQRKGRPPRRSTTTGSSIGAGGWTTCTGRPSTVGKLVRSTSWRRTTSSSVRRRTSASSGPQNQIVTWKL